MPGSLRCPMRTDRVGVRAYTGALLGAMGVFSVVSEDRRLLIFLTPMVRFSLLLRCLVTLGMCALVWAGPQASQAQTWTRTARVVAPIQTGPLQTFLDRLARTPENATRPVYRAPDDTATMALAALRDTLRRTNGLDVTTATDVTVGYRFSIDGMSGFKSEITELQFSYGGDATATRVSLLAVNPRDEWVQSMLHTDGLSLPSSPNQVRAFRDYFGFLFVTQLEGADIVEIGGRPMPEGFDVQKKTLIQQVNRFAYSDTY